MATLLEALGLPGLPIGGTGGTSPPGAAGAGAGPLLPLKPGAAAPKPIDLKLKGDPEQQARLLAEAITRVTDAVKRDELIRQLRDILARITPVIDTKKAKELIDKGIEALITKGAKDLLMAALEAITGRKPTQMPDRDQPRGQPPPPGPDKAPGEVIVKTPELPVPWDKPTKVRQGQFEFGTIAKTVRAGTTLAIDLRVRTSYVEGKEKGTGFVVLVRPDANERSIEQAEIEKKAKVQVRLRTPFEPGKYQIRIKVGPGYEWVPEPVDIELTP